MVDELVMTDGQRLLRRILECPEDDAPRLIYSDCLEEQGDLERAKEIRYFVANPTLEVATDLIESALGVHGIISIYRRGFVRSVSLTCEAFCGHACKKCHGSGIRTTVNHRNQTYANECGVCNGTGRIEGVARGLFQKHPITSVRLTCRTPNPPGYMAGWRRGELTINDGLPNEIYDLLDGYFDNHGNREMEWKSYNTEADANAALSRACVAYGRNLVGLPMLDS